MQENPIHKKKVFIYKKPTTEQKRFCLNCGADISDRRKGTKYCCPECRQASYNYDYTKYYSIVSARKLGFDL